MLVVMYWGWRDARMHAHTHTHTNFPDKSNIKKPGMRHAAAGYIKAYIL